MEFGGDEAGDQAGETMGGGRVSFCFSLKGERGCVEEIGDLRVELVEPGAPKAWDLRFGDLELMLVSVVIQLCMLFQIILRRMRRVVLTVTPQNSAKTMISGGFSSIAMKVLGVNAETI